MDAATIIKDQKETIIQNWIAKVREKIPAINKYSRTTIEDSVPGFLDALVFTLETGNKDKLIDNSQIHGFERSRHVHYSLKNIIREYHLLKETIFQQIDQYENIPISNRHTIMYAFDTAIENAAEAFFKIKQKVQVDTVKALKKKANELKLEEENREDFIQSISHDLNAPLNNIKSCLDLLENDPDINHVHQILHILKASTHQAEMLLNDFLDMSLISTAEKIPLHIQKTNILSELLNEIQIFSTSFKKNVELDCPEKELIANLDVHLIRRALNNLLNNAMKHGGHDTPIAVSCHINEKLLTISVKNYGNPIPKDVLNTIFEKYYRINPSTRGWGIGLAFVKEVALAHKGSVNVRSGQADGTTFELRIPI